MKGIKPLLVLKTYALFLALPYTIALTIVSLMHLGKLPDVGVSFGDKIFHFLAYGLFTLLWFWVFYFKYENTIGKALLYATILAIVFGMLIEILQGTLTSKRSFDIYDAVANSLGALLMCSIIYFKSKIEVKY